MPLLFLYLFYTRQFSGYYGRKGDGGYDCLKIKEHGRLNEENRRRINMAVKRKRGRLLSVFLAAAMTVGTLTGYVPAEDVQAAVPKLTAIAENTSITTVDPDFNVLTDSVITFKWKERYGTKVENFSNSLEGFDTTASPGVFHEVDKTAKGKKPKVTYYKAAYDKNSDQYYNIEVTVDGWKKSACEFYNPETGKTVPPYLYASTSVIGLGVRGLDYIDTTFRWTKYGTDESGKPVSIPLVPEELNHFRSYATLNDLDSTQAFSFEQTQGLSGLYKLKGYSHVYQDGGIIKSKDELTTDEDKAGWVTCYTRGTDSFQFRFYQDLNYAENYGKGDRVPVALKSSTGLPLPSWFSFTSESLFEVPERLDIPQVFKRVGAKGVSWEEALPAESPESAYRLNGYTAYNYLLLAGGPGTAVNSYTITDTLESCLTLSGEDPVSIQDKDGADVTGQFDIAAEGQTVRCSAKEAYRKTDSFQAKGQKFLVRLNVQRKQDGDVRGLMAPWLSEDGFTFHVPNKASLSLSADSYETLERESNQCWVTDTLKASLQVEKDAQYDGWKVGDKVEYTVNVSQSEPDGYGVNVAVTDEDIPSCLQLLDGEWEVTGPANGAAVSMGMSGSNGWRAECPLLLYGETIRIKFRCLALEDSNGKDTINTVHATAGNAKDPEGNQIVKGDDAEVWVNSPELTIDKTANAYEYQIGDKVQYTVTVRNTMDYTVARNVVVSDISLPDGLALDSQDGDGIQVQFTPDGAASQIGWPVPDGTASIEKQAAENHYRVEQSGNMWAVQADYLPSDAAMTVRFSCVATKYVNGIETQNQASVTADNFLDGEGNRRTAQDDAEVYVNTAAFQIDKRITDGKYEWQVGDHVPFDVIVRNINDENTQDMASGSDYQLIPEEERARIGAAGKTVARNVVITDEDIPAGFKLDTESIDVQAVQETAPDETVPDETITEDAFPEDGPSEGALPDEPAGEETLPDESVPDEPVPEETIPGETVPDEAIPDGSVINGAGQDGAVTEADVPEENLADEAAPAETSAEGTGAEELTAAASGSNGAAREMVYYHSYSRPEAMALSYEEGTADVSIPEEYEIQQDTGNAEDIQSIAADGRAAEAPSAEGIPESFEDHVAGTPDISNQLNTENYNETETKPIEWNLETTGNGWQLKISNLPAGHDVKVHFTCEAMEASNGQEGVNIGTVTATNATPENDDSEAYVNTAALTIDKALVNRYASGGAEDKQDGREAYEFRVGEDIEYRVTVRNIQPGSIARNVVVSDLSLPDGLVLNEGDGAVTAEGIPELYVNPVSGTEDLHSQLNPEHYNEKEIAPVTYQLTREGNGWRLLIDNLPCTENDELNMLGEPVVVTFHCTATEAVNGWEIMNTARASADNAKEVTDNERVWINSPDLQVNKEADREAYALGDTITYTVDITQEQTGCAARNLVIADGIDTEGVKLQKNSIVLTDKDGRKLNIPEECVEVNGNSFLIRTGMNMVKESGYSYYDAENGGLAVKGAYNPIGAEKEAHLTLEYSAEIIDPGLAGKSVYNKVEVNSDEKIPDGDDEDVPVEGAALSITKESDKAAYKVGETGTYKLIVRELRDGVSAKQVVVQDSFLTEGMSILPDSITVSFNGETLKDAKISAGKNSFVIETGKDMSLEDSLVIKYQVLFEEASPEGKFVNTAVAKGSNTDEVKDKNTVDLEDLTPVLEITKASDKAAYKVGETGHYSVTVTQKTEKAVAKNIIIKDVLETPGTRIAADTIRIYDHEGNEIKGAEIESGDGKYSVYTGTDLGFTESLTITYDVLFENAGLAGKNVRNTAAADADNAGEVKTDHEVAIEKGKASPTPTPAPKPQTELSITKKADKTEAAPGSTVQYTLEVKNKGKSDAINVVIIDNLKNNKAILQKESIKTYLADKEFTPKSIAAVSSGLKIETGKNLKPGEVIKVTYQVKLDPTMKSPEIRNVASTKADNTEQAETELTLKIQSVTQATPTPGANGSTGGASSSLKGNVQTGDGSPVKLIIIVLVIGVAGIIAYIRGRKKGGR